MSNCSFIHIKTPFVIDKENLLVGNGLFKATKVRYWKDSVFGFNNIEFSVQGELVIFHFFVHRFESSSIIELRTCDKDFGGELIFSLGDEIGIVIGDILNCSFDAIVYHTENYDPIDLDENKVQM